MSLTKPDGRYESRGIESAMRRSGQRLWPDMSAAAATVISSLEHLGCAADVTAPPCSPKECQAIMAGSIMIHLSRIMVLVAGAFHFHITRDGLAHPAFR